MTDNTSNEIEQNVTDKGHKKESVSRFQIPNELCPGQWRQLNIEPISKASDNIEGEVGKLIYKRVLRNSLAAMVANDVQYQHVIEHNGIKALCEITNYIFTKDFLAAPLENFDLAKIRSIILVINQRQLRAEKASVNEVEKALFVSKQMLPKWKVKSFKLKPGTSVKLLLDQIDSLMKTNIIFDLKLSMEELKGNQAKEFLIWAKCVSHKSLNCNDLSGLYESEYPKISTF